MKLRNDFPERLKRALHSAGFYSGARKPRKNFTDFAREADLHNTAVGHYLTGKYVPTIQRLKVICQVLGDIPIEYFLANSREEGRPIRDEEFSNIGRPPAYKTKVKPNGKPNNAELPQLNGEWLLIELQTSQVEKVSVLSADKESGIIVCSLKE